MLSSPTDFLLLSSLRNNLEASLPLPLCSAISSLDQLLLWRVLARAIDVSSSAHGVAPSKSFGIEFQPFLESLKAALEFIPAPKRCTWMVVLSVFWTIATSLNASIAWFPYLQWTGDRKLELI